MSDPCGKLIASKGFLDEIHSFVQNAAISYQVGGIARHIKALEVRADGAKLFGQLSAVHPRHHHVSDKQVNIFRMIFDNINGVFRRRRC